jgi:uncharacterized protein (UPF0333 family)
MVKNKKGQSTLEYIILVTAVIVVIISFLMAPNAPLSKALNSTINATSGMLDTMTDRLGNSLGNIQSGY